MMMQAGLILTVLILCSIVTFLFLRTLHYRFAIPAFFRALEERYGNSLSVSNRAFSSSISIATDIMRVEALVSSKNIFASERIQVLATHRQNVCQHELLISTSPFPDAKNSLDLSPRSGAARLYALSRSLPPDLLSMFISPSCRDTLMDLLMIETTRKQGTAFDIEIRGHSVLVRLGGMVKNERHLQLLVECAQGLVRDFCAVPADAAPAVVSSAPPLTVAPPAYLRQSVAVLVVFSVVLSLQTAYYFAKRNSIDSPTEAFSGMVISKHRVSDSEFYLFIPHRVRVTKDDFLRISEGDRVERKKGDEAIAVVTSGKASPVSDTDMLNMLNNK
jgi:hypothetical protein